MSTPRNSRTAAQRQVSKGIFWKLVIVAIALFAYSAQKALEQAKSRYDAERTKPLVVVDGSDASSASAPKNSFIALDARELKKPLPVEMWKFIDRIKYQSFGDEKAVIDRLNEEVLAESDIDKRAYIESMEALNKHRAEKLTTLAGEKSLVYGRLSQLVSDGIAEPDKEQKAASVKRVLDRLAQANPADEQRIVKLKKKRKEIDKALASASREELAVWLNTLDKQINDEQNLAVARQWISNADAVAQSQIKNIHDKFRPELSGLVRQARAAAGLSPPQNSVQAFFDPRSVFNEKSGSYVIYQTLWLICVVVIVFFVLFLFLALLRPLPFFANSSETLMQQVSRLFSGGGAGGGGESGAPQIARTLAVTAAALGIGTAVAVAGNGLTGKPPRHPPGVAIPSEASDDAEKQYPPHYPYDPRYRQPLKVELSPEIIYPQPTVIEHTNVSTSPPDNSAINTLRGRVEDLIASNATLSSETTNLRREVQKVNALDLGLQDVQKNVGGLSVPGLKAQTDLLQKDVDGNKQSLALLSGHLGRIEDGLSGSLKGFSRDLAATQQAVNDLRNNSFERTQNSGGRGFFTRTRQFFRGDRYMVSNQSYGALRDLMCRGDCTPEKEAILDVLKARIGAPPAGESGFMASFGRVDAATLKVWKPLLLKYTRVSY